MRLSVGSVVFEEASDLAIEELFNPVHGLEEPVLHGDEEVGGLPNIPDKAGGRYWGR